MPPVAYFGIESDAFNTVVSLLIVFLAILYISLVYWTYADARRRIVDPMLIACATVASLFPFVGTLVYLILRPPEYLEDVRERELETRAAEARLHQIDHGLCPHCDYPIERDFVRCPSCLRKLKERCASCAKPLDRSWTICPYCETEVADAPPRRRRRRSGGAVGEPETVAADAAATLGEEQSGAGAAAVPARPVRGARAQPAESELAREPVGVSELTSSDRAEIAARAARRTAAREASREGSEQRGAGELDREGAAQGELPPPPGGLGRARRPRPSP